MPMQFDSESRTFKLDTDCSSYLIKIHETGHILNLYYGAPIPDATIQGREKRRVSASFSPYDPVDWVS